MKKITFPILPVVIFSVIISILYFLLPDYFLGYKTLLINISSLILIITIIGYFINNTKLYVIAKLIMNYYLALTILIVIGNYLKTFLDLKGTYGLEHLFMIYIDVAKIIYFSICVLQNILLPIPEGATIIAGSAVLGSFDAFTIGLIGTLIGVSTTFLITRYGGVKLISKLVNQKQLFQYQKFAQKNETLILFVLFIVPILPDEIICIGAGLSKISIKKFLVIASISKVLTSFIYAYSIELAGLLSLTTSQMIMSLSIVMIGIFVYTLTFRRFKLNSYQ